MITGLVIFVGSIILAGLLLAGSVALAGLVMGLGIAIVVLSLLALVPLTIIGVAKVKICYRKP